MTTTEQERERALQEQMILSQIKHVIEVEPGTVVEADGEKLTVTHEQSVIKGDILYATGRNFSKNNAPPSGIC